ncbi:hypothetical protein DXG01_013605 [Tephrocybe rancida]|nr:hypothetical protein DXG01_013605 [Tephrocybe rancida]
MSTAKKAKKVIKLTSMDPSKACLLVEEDCHTVSHNESYQNPPLEDTRHNCVTAGHKVPCDLCLSRSTITLEFPPLPLPPECPPLIPFRTINVRSRTSTILSLCGPSKADPALTAKMQEEVVESFDTFRSTVRVLEKSSDPTGCTPCAAYFPTPLATCILNNLMKITVVEDIETLIPTWETFRARRQKARLAQNEKNCLCARACRAADEGRDEEEEDWDEGEDEGKGEDEGEGEDESGGEDEDECEGEGVNDQVMAINNIPAIPAAAPTKQAALQDDTNTVAPKHPQRAGQKSSAEVSGSYGPSYCTRKDRSRCQQDKNRMP